MFLRIAESVLVRSYENIDWHFGFWKTNPERIICWVFNQVFTLIWENFFPYPSISTLTLNFRCSFNQVSIFSDFQFRTILMMLISYIYGTLDTVFKKFMTFKKILNSKRDFCVQEIIKSRNNKLLDFIFKSL